MARADSNCCLILLAEFSGFPSSGSRCSSKLPVSVPPGGVPPGSPSPVPPGSPSPSPSPEPEPEPDRTGGRAINNLM